MNKEQIISKINNGKLTLEELSKEEQDDFDIVLEAVKKNAYALMYAGESLVNNKEIVMIAIKKSGWILNFVSDRFKDNEEIVLEAVKQNGYTLGYASERLKGNEKVVKKAMEKSGYVLKYASERLQNRYKLLKLLKSADTSEWDDSQKFWYKEKMEMLEILENKKEMEKGIVLSEKKSKKIKF